MKSDTQRIMQVLKMMKINLTAEERTCIRCLLNITSNKAMTEVQTNKKSTTTKKEAKANAN